MECNVTVPLQNSDSLFGKLGSVITVCFCDYLTEFRGGNVEWNTVLVRHYPITSKPKTQGKRLLFLKRFRTSHAFT